MSHKLLNSRTILAGSAIDVRTALDAIERLAGPNFSLRGAALIGPGDVPDCDVLTRASNWDELDVSDIGHGAETLILAGAPPVPSAARAVLTRAADARLKVVLMESGGPRQMIVDDVVGRQLAPLDYQPIANLVRGKRILITGGGGSIGGEIARRVATLGVGQLTLLDASEHNLYKISHELPDAKVVLADVRDAQSMKRWFARVQPEIVFHAAALKQVPIVEVFPSEGFLTNVCGLKHVADACAAIGADLIFVSTDKAVDPSGVMGASKRLGELYCQALDREYAKSGGPRALPVRLGNVLGSAGSVIPVFEQQLSQGGPLTVTDEKMTRFFLSIPQAADFLLQAASIGIGSESGRGAAFVGDMGEALPVVELAREVIRLAGLRPEIDVPITFVGLRPGEKLYEQLVASDEWHEADPAPSVIAAASAARDVAELREVIARLAKLAADGDDEAVSTELFAAIAPLATQQSALAG